MRTKKIPRRSSVVVQFAVPRRGLPGAASFRRWAAGFPGITLRIVGSREGLLLNRKFRGKAKPTNVLTFRYGEMSGDIVLCHPVILREARRQGKSLHAHYAHLVVHGALHASGYDHVTRKQAARMEREEIRRLARLGFADPYTVE
jgi:probable rRNA maturation factor